MISTQLPLTLQAFLEICPAIKADNVYECSRTGCWKHTNNLRDDGYAAVQVKGKKVRAHRLAYEVASGEPIPEGLMVRHGPACEDGNCFRPSHLSVGTAADNAADRERDGRTARGSRNGASKLTEDEVARMKCAAQLGEKARCLAEEYGVSTRTIYRILADELWTHVDPAPAAL